MVILEMIKSECTLENAESGGGMDAEAGLVCSGLWGGLWSGELSGAGAVAAAHGGGGGAPLGVLRVLQEEKPGGWRLGL